MMDNGWIVHDGERWIMDAKMMGTSLNLTAGS